MGDYIFAGIMLVISVAMFVISFRSFTEKGFLPMCFWCWE